MEAGRFAERGVRSKRPAWQKRKSLQKALLSQTTQKQTNLQILQ